MHSLGCRFLTFRSVSGVQTDSDEGLGHRYETMEAAKDLFEQWNNTDAILTAIEHCREDRRAKARVLDHPDMTEELAEILFTAEMPLTYSVSIEREIGSSD